jgi:UDP-3-O-[3-hydroxymyristoyl] glucosamine N-acyltransferase
VRDCEISYAAKVPSLLADRLVPCSALEHIEHAKTLTGISGIVTTVELAPSVPDVLGLAISDKPVNACVIVHESLCRIADFFWDTFATRIDETAQIHPTATIAPKNVVIGPGTIVGPNSVINEYTLIGSNCNIGESVVVGLDALEITSLGGPRRVMKQAGGVSIEDNVTILSKVTVVRATFGGFTKIGSETIIDTFVHVAHDCQIGKRVTLVACCEISGRCELGDDSYVGPNACLRNGISLGEKSRVNMGAVVTRDVAPNAIVSGNFAVDHGKWLNFVKGL